MRLFLYNVSRMKIVTKLIGLLSVFNAVLWTGAGSLLLWWLYVPLRLDLFGEGDIRWLHAVMVLLAMAIIVAITIRFWFRAVVFVRSDNVQDASSANRLRFAASVLCTILWCSVTVMACLAFSSWVGCKPFKNLQLWAFDEGGARRPLRIVDQDPSSMR